MIELKLNKESELSFEINVEGSDKKPRARLMFEMEDKMELALEGKVNENSVNVTVPSLMDLREKLSGDNIKGYLEVIVDETYFVPWEEYFSLKAPVTVQAESTKVDTQESPDIKISVKTKKIKEKTAEVTIIEDYQIPKTRILLEKGDKIKILSETSKEYNDEDSYEIVEGFTVPGTKVFVSKNDRIKVI